MLADWDLLKAGLWRLTLEGYTSFPSYISKSIAIGESNSPWIMISSIDFHLRRHYKSLSLQPASFFMGDLKDFDVNLKITQLLLRTLYFHL